jgi:hypothetical protein
MVINSIVKDLQRKLEMLMKSCAQNAPKEAQA